MDFLQFIKKYHKKLCQYKYFFIIAGLTNGAEFLF